MKLDAALLSRPFAVVGWSAPWFFMAALLLAWSWFNPYVYLPWTDFAKDSHIALCFVVVGVFWFWRYKEQSFGIPTAAMACVLLICAVVLQYALGYFAYGAQAMWATAALAACALICILAAQLTSVQAGRSLTALLCVAVVIAALLQLGVASAQRFRLMPYDDINLPGLFMAAARDPMRPGGNFGQPNVFATFMVWALLASGWLLSQRHLGRASYWILSGLFCFGMALAQSRMAAVSLMVLLFLSCLGARRRMDQSRLLRWMLVCIAVYLLSATALALEALGTDGTGLRSEIFSDPVRKIIYTSYFEASLLKPWYGWGMTHLAQVHWTVWPSGEGSGTLFLHAHNIVLDLALWVGWPLALLVVIWLGLRAWRRFNVIDDIASWYAFATVVALFTHASFELPHTMAFFFLPAAWWVGILSSRTDANDQTSMAKSLRPKFTIPGFLGLAASASLGIYLVLMIWEYHRIEPEFWRIRFENAKIGEPRQADLPSTWILTPLSDRIILQETQCSPLINDAQIAQLERSTRGFPSLPSLYLTACAFGLTGQSEHAQLWMGRLNRVASAEQVEHYAQLWEKQRRTAPAVVTKPWPAPKMSASASR